MIALFKEEVVVGVLGLAESWRVGQREMEGITGRDLKNSDQVFIRRSRSKNRKAIFQ